MMGDGLDGRALLFAGLLLLIALAVIYACVFVAGLS